MACGIYTAVIIAMCCCGYLPGAVPSGIFSGLKYYQNHPDYKDLYGEFESLSSIAEWPESKIKSGGYVVNTLEAALWCLLTTDGYADCVLKAVNLGRDTDTTAAVAGALAGMHYGANTIPKDWIPFLVAQHTYFHEPDKYGKCMKKQETGMDEERWTLWSIGEIPCQRGTGLNQL